MIISTKWRNKTFLKNVNVNLKLINNIYVYMITRKATHVAYISLLYMLEVKEGTWTETFLKIIVLLIIKFLFFIFNYEIYFFHIYKRCVQMKVVFNRVLQNLIGPSLEAKWHFSFNVKWAPSSLSCSPIWQRYIKREIEEDGCAN